MPSRRHDRNTPRWMRELGIIKVRDTYCQEHNGLIVKVFPHNPLLGEGSWSSGVLIDKNEDKIFVYTRGSMYAILNKDDNLSLIALRRRVTEREFKSSDYRQQMLAEEADKNSSDNKSSVK